MSSANRAAFASVCTLTSFSFATALAGPAALHGTRHLVLFLILSGEGNFRLSLLSVISAVVFPVVLCHAKSVLLSPSLPSLFLKSAKRVELCQVFSLHLFTSSRALVPRPVNTVHRVT